MMEPTPSINKAFSLVIQEERQRSSGFNMGSSVGTTALAVKNQSFTHSFGFASNSGKNFKGNAGKGRPMCIYCGKLGHIKERCYKLVGFPPGVDILFRSLIVMHTFCICVPTMMN